MRKDKDNGNVFGDHGPWYMSLSDSLRLLSSCLSPKYLQMHGLHALIAITRVHRALAHMMLTHEKCALQAPDVPLDVLGAESEGQIGYLLETALAEALPESEVALYTSACHLKAACFIIRADTEPAYKTPQA